MMLSLLPLRCSSHHSSLNKTILDEIIYEFRHIFKILSDKLISADEGRYGSSSSYLKRRILSSKGGSSSQLNQLLIALLRVIGFEVRLVYCVQPCSLHPKDHRDIKESKLDGFIDLTKSDDATDIDRHLLLRSWCEVNIIDAMEDEAGKDLSKISSRYWICIDIASSASPVDIEKSIKQSSKFQPQYVVAVEADGYTVDLTMRYLTKQSIYEKVQKEYAIKSWWCNVLLETNKIIWKYPHTKRMCRMYELLETMNLKSIETEPTSFSAFKDHPRYILERDLKSNEVLNPHKKKAVRIFRGEVVYNRDAVETVRSRIQWMKLLRQIRVEDQETPVKISHITRRSSSSSISSSSSDVERISVKLFGSWQTEPLTVPPVVDDILPVNEHGNIEIWDGCLALVPQGAALIAEDTTAVIKAAKYLDLPYAPAVFGFDRNSGNYSIPRIGGVVVLAQHEASIRSAASHIFDSLVEKAEMKRQAIIVKRWEHLTRGLITRAELRKKYGH